jgi:hypothetical protein
MRIIPSQYYNKDEVDTLLTAHVEHTSISIDETLTLDYDTDYGLVIEDLSLDREDGGVLQCVVNSEEVFSIGYSGVIQLNMHSEEPIAYSGAIYADDSGDLWFGY